MWIYDAVIYIYALSLLCTFSDFLEKNRKMRQLGTGLLVFVWLLQSAFLVLRLTDGKTPLIANLFETLFFLSWLLVGGAAFLQSRLKTDLPVLVINLFSFGILVLTYVIDPDATPTLSGWEIQDELLFIHISLAIASYAAFLIAAILSAMYLFLHNRLKRKKWSQFLKKMPGLGTIDLYAFRFVVLGTPLLIASLILGIVWVGVTGEYQLLVDPKVLNSLLVLAGYTYYFVQRYTNRAPGFRLAAWNLTAFAIVVINFVVSNYISGFHQWIWM